MSEGPRPRHIVITNIVSLNTGDAAILWGMFQILRERYGADTRFTVFDKSAEAANKYYPWATFRQALFGNRPKSSIGRKLQVRGYGHWVERLRYLALCLASYLIRLKADWLARLFLSGDDFRSVSEYVHADLVVSTGGTYLTENYGLWTNIRDYRLTFAAGTPLVFFTQTLGPFTQPKYRKAFKDIFSRSAAIFLRDERSRKHVVDLGIPAEKITLAKDAAFVIKAQPSTAPAGPFRIAISVRTMHFFDDSGCSIGERYKSSVIAMVSAAVREHGAEVVFLSTCQGIPEYWTDDASLADEIVEGLPEDVASAVTVDRRFRQPTEIVETYQKFHLVIATRMHAAILGLVAGIPVLGVAYEFKLEELFDQLGMNDAKLSTREMDEKSAQLALGLMLRNIDRFRNQVLSIQSVCREQASVIMENLPYV